MKCITDNIAEAKTTGIQIGVGLLIVLVSTVSKSLILFGIGAVVLGIGIRGIVNICKNK